MPKVETRNELKEKVKELQSEHNKLKNRMDKLTDLFLDGDFGEAEYKEKRKSLEQKRDDLLERRSAMSEAPRFKLRLARLVEVGRFLFLDDVRE